MGVKAKLPASAGGKLDKEIERLYYKHADRRPILMTKIPLLFRNAREMHLQGTPLEEAVKASIEIYCDPKTEIHDH